MSGPSEPMPRKSSRSLPQRIEERLIVALDLPTIAAAREMVSRLDGLVSFFKIGLWLLYAAGVEALIDDLLARNKRVFLDAKMYDIGETVKQGVARAASRGISFLTVHGDRDILHGAAEGRGQSGLQLLAISVLTSIDDQGLRDLGYLVAVERLIEMRVRNVVDCGIDGIVASAQDNPERIRQSAGAPGLLIVTPGIRLPGGGLDDHKRSGSPAQAIHDGADYLVVGRPIIKADDPAAAAQRIIADMMLGAGG